MLKACIERAAGARLRGLALFANTAEAVEKDGSRTVPALDAFKLHDTYGFPIDLTLEIAEEENKPDIAALLALPV